MTIVCSTYSVQASTKDLEEIVETEYGKGNTNNPLWWPGNPNPKPGSAYKAPKDATTARRCAIQALGGIF